jgi:hypothetical protein
LCRRSKASQSAHTKPQLASFTNSLSAGFVAGIGPHEIAPAVIDALAGLHERVDLLVGER